MRRRVGRILGLSFGLLLLLVGGLILFRTAIVEAVLKNRMAARNIPVASLTVDAVGIGRARILDLNLGDKGELRAREIVLRYEFGGLLNRRFRRLTIDGLAVRLDLTGDGHPLGSLQPLFEAGDDSAAIPVPEVVITASQLSANTPLGPVAAEFNGEAWPQGQAMMAAVVTFAVTGPLGAFKGATDMVVDPDGETAGNLVIEDGAAQLPGAEITGITAEAAYRLFPDRPPAIDAAISAKRVTLPGGELDAAQVTLRTTETRASLTAQLTGAGGSWSLTLDGALDDYLAAPAVRLTLEGDAEAESAFWRLLDLPEPDSGQADFRASTKGRLPPLVGLELRDDELAEWIRGVTLSGTAELGLGALAYPGRAEDLSVAATLDGKLENGSLRFAMPQEAVVEITGLTPTWLRELGLPEAVVPVLTRGGRLTWTSEGTATQTKLTANTTAKFVALSGAVGQVTTSAQLRFDEDRRLAELRLDGLDVAMETIALPGLRVQKFNAHGALAGRPDALTGDLDVNLDARQVVMADLRASKSVGALPLSVETAPRRLSLRLRDSGTATVSGLTYGGLVQTETPLILDLQALSAQIVHDQDGALNIEHDGRVSGRPVTLRITRPDGAINVQAEPNEMTWRGKLLPGRSEELTARVENANVQLPEEQIAVQGITATYTRKTPPDNFRADLSLGAVKHLADLPIFSPLSAAAELHGDSKKLNFEMTLHGAVPGAELVTSGKQNLSTERGQARIALAPLTFEPGVLQPDMLFPPLKALRKTTGKVQGDAALNWAADGVTGTANLSLADLSFDSDQAKVRGLDLDLTLDQLFPPGSAADQRLNLERIDPGVPLDAIETRFQILPATPTRLMIQSSEVALLGGRLFLHDMLIDPASERQMVPLQIEGLDLAQLFQSLGVAGLTGSGRLSGRIPITLGSEGIVIENGRLAAEAPGLLKFRSDEAAQVLAGAGEAADLMLRALEDFHYDELTLTIDKQPTADARLHLVLLGQNPVVLEGHPFKFNINLEGNTDRVFEAVSEAYSLSNNLLTRAWRLGH